MCEAQDASVRDARRECARHEGARCECAGRECSRRECARHEGARRECVRREGARDATARRETDDEENRFMVELSALNETANGEVVQK